MPSKCLICVHLRGWRLKFSVLDLGSHVSGFSWLTSGCLPHTIRSLNEYTSMNQLNQWISWVNESPATRRVGGSPHWKCEAAMKTSLRAEDTFVGVVAHSYKPAFGRIAMKSRPTWVCEAGAKCHIWDWECTLAVCWVRPGNHLTEKSGRFRGSREWWFRGLGWLLPLSTMKRIWFGFL